MHCLFILYARNIRHAYSTPGETIAARSVWLKNVKCIKENLMMFIVTHTKETSSNLRRWSFIILLIAVCGPFDSYSVHEFDTFFWFKMKKKLNNLVFFSLLFLFWPSVKTISQNSRKGIEKADVALSWNSIFCLRLVKRWCHVLLRSGKGTTFGFRT